MKVILNRVQNYKKYSRQFGFSLKLTSFWLTFIINGGLVINFNYTIMGIKTGPKRIAKSTGKPDRRQHDNKKTPGNTPSLKPHDHKKGD